MNQTQLRQLQNNVEVVGILKSKELEVKTSMDGKNYMSGKLVVQSKIDGKINEQKISVFIMQSSKLYRGIVTVKNEYKAIDQDGIENADRIKVKGSLKLNEYYNNQGNLVQFNEVRGMIFNRLDTDDTQKDIAVASIESIVQRFDPILKGSSPTGDYSVKGFTVGWNGEVIELKDTFIGPELVQPFMNLYIPGSTGRLSFKLSSHVEEEEEQTSTIGFGTSVNIEDTFETSKKYVNSIEIIGGDVPFFGTKEYTSEEIKQAIQVRTLKLQSMKAPSSGIPQTNTGFGVGFQSQITPTQIKNKMPLGSPDQMPDF